MPDLSIWRDNTCTSIDIYTSIRALATLLTMPAILSLSLSDSFDVYILRAVRAVRFNNYPSRSVSALFLLLLLCIVPEWCWRLLLCCCCFFQFRSLNLSAIRIVIDRIISYAKRRVSQSERLLIALLSLLLPLCYNLVSVVAHLRLRAHSHMICTIVIRPSAIYILPGDFSISIPHFVCSRFNCTPVSCEAARYTGGWPPMRCMLVYSSVFNSHIFISRRIHAI